MSLAKLERQADLKARAARYKRLEFQRHADRTVDIAKKRIASPLGLALAFGVGFLAGNKGQHKRGGETSESTGALRKGTARVFERTAASMVTSFLVGGVLGNSASVAGDLLQRGREGQ